MKRIILVAGHAGSGKTTFSRLLASRLGWPLLDKDTLTQPLVGALAALLTGDPDDRQSALYLENIRPLEYRALMDTAWEAAEAAAGVVVAAPFVKELLDGVWMEEFGSECAARRIAPVYVWMHCDEDTHKARIIDRNSPRDRWKVLNWTQWQSSLPSPPPGSGVIHVDNSAGASTRLEAVASRIAELAGRRGGHGHPALRTHDDQSTKGAIMGQEVFNAEEWQSLPIGTVARIETVEDLDDGNQKDIIVYVLRVDADIRVDAGPYMLAGGSHWRNAWEWSEGGTVIDLDAVFSATPGEVA